MRKKAILIALLCIITGCTVNKNHSSCPAYSQCDEMYIGDYNCDIQPRITTTTASPWGYAPVPGIYGNPTYNPYRSYYPNTQSVYYVPQTIIIPVNNSNNESQSGNTTSVKRPSIVKNTKRN